MKGQWQLLALVALLAAAFSSSAMTPQERKAYLEKLVQTLPPVPSFNTWLQRTGELPPASLCSASCPKVENPIQALTHRWDIMAVTARGHVASDHVVIDPYMVEAVDGVLRTLSK